MAAEKKVDNLDPASILGTTLQSNVLVLETKHL